MAKKKDYKDLGAYIKNKRIALGVSLNQFSFANDINPTILSRIENLKQGIKMNILINVAKGFGKTLGEFLVEYEKSK